MKLKLLCIFLIVTGASLALYGQDVLPSNGGPYSTDANTKLLMHFDGNLNEEASNHTINNNGISKSYISSPISGLGNAVYFDNTISSNQSFVSVPQTGELSFSGSWTIEFWFSINSWDQSHNCWPAPIVLPTTGWDANFFLEIPSDSHKLKYGFTGNNGGVILFSSIGISTDTWYHLAMINDFENKNLKMILHDSDFLIIDEQILSYENNTVISTGTQDLKIGTGIAGDNFFDGYMDELRISDCVRDFSPQQPELPPLQAQTERLEFYSTEENASLWNNISESMQHEYDELSSYWDRPGNDPVVPEGTKIKLYLLSREDFLQYAGSVIPDWKCGWFDNETYTVIVTQPVAGEQQDFYGSFESLAKGTMAQLIVKLKLISSGNNSAPQFFLEGFGIYRGGYRPQKTMILEAINDLGRLPVRSDLENSDNLNQGYMKDLIASYIECQLFNGISYLGINTWMGSGLWNPYFQYYYQNEDAQRIMLRRTSANFDIYCTTQDIPYLDAIVNKLEEKLAHYTNCYEMEIKNRFNIVVFPNEAAGMACMGYGDHYNGGSGCGGDKLDILSPVNFSGGIEEATYSLIPHEFFHVFHNHMSPGSELLVGFHAEGLAEVMAYEGTNLEYLQNRDWYFKDGIQRFQQENGRDPKLADIMPDFDGYMSVYSYGQAFYYYMLQNHATYVKLKEFFNAGNDWSVFDASYEEIDNGYVEFLKTLAGLATDVDNNSGLPAEFNLEQNYPNPFNPSTIITFTLPETENVKLVVYDLIGKEVAKLIDGNTNAGKHQIKFNASGLSSGIYFYQLTGSNTTLTKKMLLMK